MKTNNLRLEWLDVADLADSPLNWREHPPEQTDALRDILADVGWAGALPFNETTGRLCAVILERMSAMGCECQPVEVALKQR